jgi:hypothetical protein
VENSVLGEEPTFDLRKSKYFPAGTPKGGVGGGKPPPPADRSSLASGADQKSALGADLKRIDDMMKRNKVKRCTIFDYMLLYFAILYHT